MSDPFDFAAAQRRIAARRQAREAESQALIQARRDRSQIEARLTKLPAPLSVVGRAGISFWESIKGREGTGPAFRVGQVDAELLDEELLSLLKNQVGDAFKYFGNRIQDDWSDEISLTLRAILFKLSVWDHGTLPYTSTLATPTDLDQMQHTAQLYKTSSSPTHDIAVPY